jgi:hypothetical protein
MALDVAAVQRALRAEGLDGWLLYDFHGSNPIAARLGRTHGWRAYDDAPVVLPHSVKRRTAGARARHRAAQPRCAARTQDGVRGTRGARDRAHASAAGRDAPSRWSIRPTAAIPYLSRLDAGTAEAIRGRGVEILSSGDLVQLFEAAWSASPAGCRTGRRPRRSTE